MCLLLHLVSSFPHVTLCLTHKQFSVWGHVEVVRMISLLWTPKESWNYCVIYQVIPAVPYHKLNTLGVLAVGHTVNTFNRLVATSLWTLKHWTHKHSEFGTDLLALSKIRNASNTLGFWQKKWNNAWHQLLGVIHITWDIWEDRYTVRKSDQCTHSVFKRLNSPKSGCIHSILLIVFFTVWTDCLRRKK